MAIRSCAKAILIDGDKVLLNKCTGDRGEAYYELPGGGQNQEEPLEDTVVREVLEETGYPVAVERFAVLCEEIYDDGELREKWPDYVHKVHHIFIVKPTGEPAGTPAGPDFRQEKSVWVYVGDVPFLPLRPRQVKENFSRILRSEHPLYLGVSHI